MSSDLHKAYFLALKIFKDPQAAMDWLKTPNDYFFQKSPLETLDDTPKSVLELLERKVNAATVALSTEFNNKVEADLALIQLNADKVYNPEYVELWMQSPFRDGMSPRVLALAGQTQEILDFLTHELNNYPPWEYK